MRDQGTSLLQESERSVGFVVGELQQHVWDMLADKAIARMPKYVLAKEANRVLADFVFSNTEMGDRTGPIRQDYGKTAQVGERYIGGFVELIKRQIRHSFTEGSEQPAKKLSTRRIHKKSDKICTEEPLRSSVKLSQNKTNPFSRLFLSQQTQEQIMKDEMMRTSKHEVVKHAQELEKSEKEQRAIKEQRGVTQQKKFKQAKEFTFDYEGKIVNVPKKQGGNLKLFNIKSSLKNASKPLKLNKAYFNQRLANTEKVATIKNKRLVSNDSRFFQQQQGSILKASTKGRASLQHNFMELFRSGKDVEMGVSLTDLGNRSKMFGDHLNIETKLKLSDFKEMKSSFKPRTLNFSDMVKKTQNKIVSEVANRFEPKAKPRELFFDSDAQSKIISASSSDFVERSGTITKNEKAFIANFE